jgi:hypothetical protein
MSFPRFAGVFALVALCASCSMLGSSSSDVFGDAEGPVTIHVRNNNFQDATLSLVTRGRRVFLGTVTGKMETRLTAPVPAPADVWHVEIDLVGGIWCRTDEIDVDPGDVLDLLIQVDTSNQPGCYPPGARPGD